MSLTNVLIGLITKYRRELLNFCRMSEADIFSIWYKEGDIVEELDTMVYTYNSPTYQKMVFKFRSFDGEPALFYASCDDYDKYILLKWFGMYRQEVQQIMDFFVWLTCHRSTPGVIKCFIGAQSDEQQNFINLYEAEN